MAVFTFDKANSNNYKKRGDYGIRVARPGYDAEKCAQNQLIFNSNWPILQIAKVIDLDKKTSYESIYWDIANKRWVNSIPSGLSIHYYWSINKDTANKKFLFHTGMAYGHYDSNYNIKYWQFTYKRYAHNLGYVPFFFSSSYISNISNKVILSSIDISKDVDYPYTEGALPMISLPNDYGISSTSLFGKNVPGLSSNMFSKLVQCVKTDETCNWKINSDTGQGIVTDKILCWSPFNNQDAIKAGEVNKFEAFAFSAYKSPFLNLNNQDMIDYYDGIDNDPFDSNSLYYSMDAYVGVLALQDNSLYNSAVAYSNFSPNAPHRDNASLVILRSPMVSPEYQEIRI